MQYNIKSQCDIAWPDPVGLATFCRNLLRQSLIEFYLPRSIDRSRGGYHEVLRGETFVNNGKKTAVLQARQLWFASTLARRGIGGPAADEAAHAGFEHLSRALLDPAHGGVYVSCDDAGAPSNDRKHAYCQSIAIYALVEWHRAGGGAAALDMACELFDTLDRAAHDARHGGYVEWFLRDWTPITDPAAPRLLGRGAEKTLAAHMHLLEAFADLYRVWPDARLGRRVEELVRINRSMFVEPFDNAVNAHRADWSIEGDPRGHETVYGHDIEVVSFLLDAAEALDLPRGPLVEHGERVLRACLRRGYDHERGGFFHRGRLGCRAHDTRKTGWAQAEALVCLLRLHEATGHGAYFDRFVETLGFIASHIVAHEGGWYAEVGLDGSRERNAQRAGPWQGAYHEARALLYAAETLDRLAASLRPQARLRQ